MKSKELMIGDWVYVAHQHSNQEGDYDIEFIAEKLTLNHFKFWADNDWNNSDFDEFLEPIPLTKEILEKNGFKFDGDCIYKLGDYKIVIEWSGGFLFGWVFCYKKQLNYVHELQHVLNLCNVYKKIVL